ncbi:MAG: 50S ribosomal protein L15 [Deltaproteobacteria bacterium]|nr:50S ribosomal protein L15 [Deltaproteobacteria bacterium]
MGTTLDRLSGPKGARQKAKRVGRGHGSGLGTTAGRGMKGQRARSGVNRSAWFEGGQMPIQRRLPKRGFKNPFRAEYFPVNVSQLAKAFGPGDAVDADALKARGMMPRRAERLKVLGDGELAVKLVVRAHAFSKAALEKIQAAGGSAEVVPGKGTPTTDAQA